MKVQSAFQSADQLHRQLESRWATFYGLSRNWRRWASALQQANTPNDKDVVIDEIKREWGQPLFIPYGFAVIETNVPRILSQAPRYRALPGELSEGVQESLAPMEAQFEQDDAETHFERRLQETVRSGLRYGLGVQKSYWEKKCRSGKALQKKMLRRGYSVVDKEIVVYEGPQHESVDIFDFFWDPVARDMESARYAIHRTWRDLTYIESKVAEGKKRRAEGDDHGWLELDLEQVKSLASSTRRSDTWSARYEAAGLSGYQPNTELFEIWEYHDRDYIYTVLGGSSGILVQEDVNPFLHGDLPFDIFRPTIVEQEFCGIGEIEPIAHLLWELNTLRGQRRDAANLALNRGYFYQRGTLDPRDVTVGAGVFVPVNSAPDDVIQPMPFVDPPNSGYQEEAAIKADIELASAISESVVGSGGEETATGTQLVQQAANYRIKMKAKNLHVDLLVPCTAKRRALYEQMVAPQDGTKMVRVEDSTAETGFRHIPIDAQKWAANFEMVPIDGSMEPDDPAQRKHDATELMQSLIPLMQSVNAPAAINYVLEQHGVQDKTKWVKQGPSPQEAASQSAESLATSFIKAMEGAGLQHEEIEQISNAAHAQLSEAGPAQAPEGPEQQATPEQPSEPPQEEPAPEAPQPAGAY